MTADTIKQSRLAAGHTQEQAAKLVHVSRTFWAMCERGERNMSAAVFELYLIKTGKK